MRVIMAFMEVVNGYPCKNCTDVEYAKKGIDPARPKDGPNGVYAADNAKPGEKPDPSKAGGVDDTRGAERGPAVTLSGAFAQVQASGAAEKTQPYQPGASFNISA